ncbi:MAG: hypothetical protein IJ287_00580 [Methanobrevibacter sp.]|nr:hypothetical protein [Methanobrevibacter sp.]
MDRSLEYLIGGTLCLIIAIVAYIMFNRISAGSIVGVALFIYGLYRFFIKR